MATSSHAKAAAETARRLPKGETHIFPPPALPSLAFSSRRSECIEWRNKRCCPLCTTDRLCILARLRDVHCSHDACLRPHGRCGREPNPEREPAQAGRGETDANMPLLVRMCRCACLHPYARLCRLTFRMLSFCYCSDVSRFPVVSSVFLRLWCRLSARPGARDSLCMLEIVCVRARAFVLPAEIPEWR